MRPIETGNLFADLPPRLPEERVETLMRAPGARVERIVSTGQASDWFDQAGDEWVVLLRGGAGLMFEGEVAERRLAPGDWLLIPARTRHRVSWTAPDEVTVWLAVHAAEEGD